MTIISLTWRRIGGDLWRPITLICEKKDIGKTLSKHMDLKNDREEYTLVSITDVGDAIDGLYEEENLPYLFWKKDKK